MAMLDSRDEYIQAQYLMNKCWREWVDIASEELLGISFLYDDPCDNLQHQGIPRPGREQATQPVTLSRSRTHIPSGICKT